MISVKDLNPEIFSSSSFLKYLPQTCEYCGSDLEVLETLSNLQCSNKKCVSKIGYRLNALLEDIGIDLLTLEDCISFLKNFESSNPYSIFLYNPEKDGELYQGFGEEKSLELYKEINKKRGMLLWEFVRIGNFEHLRNSCEKVLGKYNDLNTFYNDLYDGGIVFIQNLLLEDTEYIKKENENEIAVDAVLIYETFIANKDDLEEGLDGVVLLKPEKKFSILFANDVSEYKSNFDFLHMVNTKLKNNIYLYPTYTLRPNIDFVYWENSELNIFNTIIEKVETEYTDIKIVNKDNIFNVLLEVLSHEK